MALGSRELGRDSDSKLSLVDAASTFDAACFARTPEDSPTPFVPDSPSVHFTCLDLLGHGDGIRFLCKRLRYFRVSVTELLPLSLIVIVYIL